MNKAYVPEMAIKVLKKDPAVKNFGNLSYNKLVLLLLNLKFWS